MITIDREQAPSKIISDCRSQIDMNTRGLKMVLRSLQGVLEQPPCADNRAAEEHLKVVNQHTADIWQVLLDVRVAVGLKKSEKAEIDTRVSF